MVHDILTTHVVQWCSYPTCGTLCGILTHMWHSMCGTVHGVNTLHVLYIRYSTWFSYLTCGTVYGVLISHILQHMVTSLTCDAMHSDLTLTWYSTWCSYLTCGTVQYRVSLPHSGTVQYMVFLPHMCYSTVQGVLTPQVEQYIQ
jgi:predicted metal-binding protein